MSLMSSQVAQRKQLIDAATASPELIKVQQILLMYFITSLIVTYHFIVD